MSASAADVFELERLPVDAAGGRCDPVGYLARLVHRLHERLDVLDIARRRQPLALALLELLGRDEVAGNIEGRAGVDALVAVEAAVRQDEAQPRGDAALFEPAGPLVDGALAVLD